MSHLQDDRSSHPDDANLLLCGLDTETPAVDDATAAHVSSCEPCRRRLRCLVDADRQLQGLGGPDDWTLNARRVRARAELQARLSAESASWPAPRPQPVSLAVGAVLCLGLVAIGITAGFQWLGRGGAEPRAASLDTKPPTVARALPIRRLTPGATVAIPVDELCRARAVEPSAIPAAVRASVLRSYGMEAAPDHEYELDFLITPELGGSPDPRNLWPEPYHSPVWNAAVKDELEWLLPRLVCAGQLDLETAQRDIAVDWIAAYKKYFKTDRPLRRG